MAGTCKFIETKESVYARESSLKFVKNMAILKNQQDQEIGQVQNQNDFWNCLAFPNKHRILSKG